MGVRILIKSSIKGYSEEQEGERGRDKFSYSDRSTTAFHHTDHIQVFPGFTLLQDRWESSGKDDTHLWGNHIEKKNKLLHLTAKYVRKQCVLYLFIPNCLLS